MKKSVLFAGAFVAALALGGLQAQTVSAADGTTTDPTTSTAEFTIGKPTDANDHNASGLYLSAMPSFKFEDNPTLDKVISGDTEEHPLSLTSSTTNNKLEIKDYSTTSQGWNVTATIGDFKTASEAGSKSDKITDATLTYTQSAPTGDNVSTSGQTAVNFNSKVTLTSGDKTQIISTPQGTGQGTTSTTASGATLAIPKHPNAKAETYTATITWALAGPTPDAPASGTPE